MASLLKSSEKWFIMIQIAFLGNLSDTYIANFYIIIPKDKSHDKHWPLYNVNVHSSKNKSKMNN